MFFSFISNFHTSQIFIFDDEQNIEQFGDDQMCQ